MNALEIIFTIFMVLFAIRIIGRWAFPFLVKRFIQKTQQKFYNQNPDLDPSNRSSKEGEINIKYNTKPKEKLNDLGDYVDFEEIKEK